MGSAAGGGPVISPNQAKKEYQALPDYAKRKQAAPKGSQQYGTAERYHLAGVAPGWFNPALNKKSQYDKLLEVEAAKRQERRDRLNPPIIPPTRGAPISVSSGGPVTVPSGAFSPSAVTVPSGAFSPSTQGFIFPSGPPGISGPTINWDQPTNVAPLLDPESWLTRDLAGQMPQYHPSLEEGRWMGAQERAGIAAGLSRSDVMNRIQGANPWRRRIAEGRNLRLDDWGRPQGLLNPRPPFPSGPDQMQVNPDGSATPYPWVPPRQETPSYGQADPTGTPWTPEQHSQAQARRTIYENNPHYESFWRERQQAIDAGEQVLDPWRPSNVPREVALEMLSTPSGPPQPAGLTVRPGTTPPSVDQFGTTFTPEQLDQQALTRQRMRDQMTELGTNPFLPKGSGNRTREPNAPTPFDRGHNYEGTFYEDGATLTPNPYRYAPLPVLPEAPTPFDMGLEVQEPPPGSGYFGPKGTGTGGSGFGPKGTGFSAKGSGGRASTPSMQNALTATGSQNQLPITPYQFQPQSLGSRRALSIRDQFINSFL